VALCVYRRAGLAAIFFGRAGALVSLGGAAAVAAVAAVDDDETAGAGGAGGARGVARGRGTGGPRRVARSPGRETIGSQDVRRRLENEPRAKDARSLLFLAPAPRRTAHVFSQGGSRDREVTYARLRRRT
jgi:hypothetical protein